jgi:hypothetical protein
MHTFAQLSRWFYRQATVLNVLLFLGLQLTFSALIFPNLQSRMGTQLQPLDIRFGFTPQEAHDFLVALGPEGRQWYRWTELVADSIYPLVYGLFLILLISFLFERVFSEGSIWRRANLLPLLIVVADYTENAGILTLLNRFPAPADGVARLASTANILKWGFFPVVIILLMVGLGGLIYNRAQRR